MDRLGAVIHDKVLVNNLNKQIISYKLQYVLSLIPFIGLIIIWIISWCNIFKITKNKLYVFLHSIIWAISLLIYAIVFVVICINLIKPIDSNMRQIIFIISSYIVVVACALSAIEIEKRIIKKFNYKQCIRELL